MAFFKFFFLTVHNGKLLKVDQKIYKKNNVRKKIKIILKEEVISIKKKTEKIWMSSPRKERKILIM